MAECAGFATITHLANEIESIHRNIQLENFSEASGPETLLQELQQSLIEYYNLVILMRQRHASIQALLHQIERKGVAIIKSYGVPGLINGVPVLAFPDTGSSLDAISESFASRHSFTIEKTKGTPITLPNGHRSRTVGVTKAKFQFRGEEGCYTRIFHILPQYSEDLILGKGFLDATETLTTHACRIEEQLRPCVISGHRVFFLEAETENSDQWQASQQLLQCTVNGQDALALPDTESDLMLVSRDFAQRHSLTIYPELQTMVQLADGSTSWTDGMVLDVELGFNIPSTAELRHADREYNLTEYAIRAKMLAESLRGSKLPNQHLRLIYDLHVMNNLPHDVILSNQFVFEWQVFSKFASLFVVHPLDEGSTTKQRTADVVHVVRNKEESWVMRLASKRKELQSRFLGKAKMRQEPTQGPSTWEEFVAEETEKRDLNDRQIWRFPEPQRTEALKLEKQRRALWDAEYLTSKGEL
ncbi:hypothetical protein ACJZ2D_009773 [Fusarium nematophilum]